MTRLAQKLAQTRQYTLGGRGNTTLDVYYAIDYQVRK